MTTRSWIRQLFGRTPRTVRKAPARCRPAVEELEDRRTPAGPTLNYFDTRVLHGIAPGSYSAPALGDVDGDGRLDLVVGDWNGKVRLIKITGPTDNPSYVEQPGAANPFDGINVLGYAMPALGDLDGDGDLDLVVGHGGTGAFGEQLDDKLEYFENTGTATYPVYQQRTGDANPFNSLSFRLIPTAPALGDMDGDGALDLVVGHWNGRLRYFENTGTASSPAYAEQTGAANPLDGLAVANYARPALADVDGDGDVDVVAGEFNGPVSYFENTGTASSPAYVKQTGAANPFDGISGQFRTPALGDLDGDGDLDAYVGAYDGTVSHFENTGTATGPAYTRRTDADPRWTEDANPFLGISVGGNASPTLADVDGDGRLDVVVGDSNGALSYYRNTGTASSPSYTQQTGAANPFDGILVGLEASPALGDVDGDSDLDLVVGGSYATTSAPRYRYCENTGTRTHPVYTERPYPNNPFAAFRDLQLSSGTFLAALNPSLGDVDGDGDIDAVLGEQGGSVLYYLNTGTATSPAYEQQPGAAIWAGGNASPTLADVDGDGRLDVLVGDWLGSLHYFRNTGTASSPSYTHLTGAANPFDGAFAGYAATPSLGDIDGDGDLDLVVGNLDGTLRYFRANRAPTLDRAIRDQTFKGKGVLSYSVPSDSFSDLDHDTLTYGATLVDGWPLPAWLHFDPATRTFSGNPEPGDASPIQVRLTAADGSGGRTSDDFHLTLSDVADNTAPTIDRGQPAVTVNEGSQANNSGHFDDVDGRGTVTLTASLGTVTGNAGAGSWSWSYTPSDGPAGPTTVTITATDSGGLTATTTFTLGVTDVAPSIAISGAGSVDEGSPYVLILGAVSDPGADTVSQYVVHWGDGTTDTYTTGGDKTHTYADGPATRAITVDLTDEVGTHASRANLQRVTVNNVAPTITAFTVPASGPEGSPLSLSADAADPAGDADPLGFIWTITRPDSSTFTLAGESASFTPADDGNYAVSLTVSDDDGDSVTQSGSIAVTNVAATATLSNDGPVDEASPATVRFSDPSDPSSADTTAGFHYSFALSAADLATSFAAASTATAANFTFADNGSYTVCGRIFDKDGDFTDYTTTVVVNNVAPTAAVSGPSTGVRGQSRSLTVSASDVSGVDQAAGFEYTVNWGDGSPVETIARTAGNGSGVTLEHIFTASGNFTVTVTATDQGNATSTPASHTLSIVAVQMQGNDLVVGGTTGNDRINITPGLAGAVKVLFGGVSQGSFRPTGKIVVYGQGGDDKILVATGVRLPAWLYGGDGNDTLRGGSGPDLLLGETGNDAVHAGAGDDHVDGGDGNDVLRGDGGADSLLSGTGNDVIQAGTGNDHVDAGTGNNHVAGATGDDTITTGAGNDTIDAGVGNDQVDAGAGNNRVAGGTGDDTVVGGTGSDDINAGPGNDQVHAGAGNNRVAGADGNDTIVTGSGDDRIDAGRDDDLVMAGAGNDRVNAGAGDGDDVLVGGGGNDTLAGNEGHDLLIGGLGRDNLAGYAGDDLLIAGETAFDGNQAALVAIVAEWTSGRSYAERVANLKGTGSGWRANGDSFLNVSGPNATVFDDGAVDQLQGAVELDWYFANRSGGVLDPVSGRGVGEIVEELNVLAP